MTFPFTLPAWVPWWVPVLVLIPAVLYAAVLLIMPFSVIGLKRRLDNLDARLDDIQGEIRTLALRLPEPSRYGPERDAGGMRPPIPPAARTEDGSVADFDSADERRPLRGPMRGRPPGREEPKLNWPR